MATINSRIIASQDLTTAGFIQLADDWASLRRIESYSTYKIRDTFAEASSIATLVNGDKVMVTWGDTGTHTSVVGDVGSVNGQTPNSGYFTYSSGLGKLVRDKALEPDVAKAWAQGTIPGGVGTKSAKEWAEVALNAIGDIVPITLNVLDPFPWIEGRADIQIDSNGDTRVVSSVGLNVSPHYYGTVSGSVSGFGDVNLYSDPFPWLIGSASVQVDTDGDTRVIRRSNDQKPEAYFGLTPNAGNAGVSFSLRPDDKSRLLQRQRFIGTTPAANWQLNGWTWNEGLVPSTTGWTTLAVYNKPSSIANKVLRIKVRLNAATDIVGPVFDSRNIESEGGAFMLNGTTNALELYTYPDDQTAVLGIDQDLPVGFMVAGEDYTIELTKDKVSWSCTVSRSKTRETVTLTHVSNMTANPEDYARMHGAPGIVCLAGTPKVLQFDYVAQIKPQPFLVVVGDSIAEGTGISTNTNDWQECWLYKLDDARKLRYNTSVTDIVMAVKGGDDNANFQNHISDVLDWRPKYVLIQLGSNDNSASLTRSGTQSLINAALSVGAIPILATYVPRGDPGGSRQLLLDSANNDIRNHYFGNYEYIDFARSCSINNDGSTIDTSLYHSGTVHPNVLGNQYMYEQLLVDAPFLLTE